MNINDRLGDRQKEWMDRLAKFMMVSVHERYLLMYKFGYPEGRVKSLDLTGRPEICASEVNVSLGRLLSWGDQFTEVVDAFIAVVFETPLPEGIPE